MRMADAYKGALKILRRYAKENPGKTVPINGNKVPVEEVTQELSKVVSWVHPEMMTDDLVKVVRCAKCINYKSYHKKNVFKAPSFKMCSLDRVKQTPDYYCARGEEK